MKNARFAPRSKLTAGTSNWQPVKLSKTKCETTYLLHGAESFLRS